MCPIQAAIKSMSTENGNCSSAGLNAAYKAAQSVYQKKVDGLMCSESDVGLVSFYQPKFWAMHHLIPYKTKLNDGMVEFESCAGGFPASKFGPTWQNRFYSTRLNHYDMTFREGDAPFDKAKMPLKWFECLL